METFRLWTQKKDYKLREVHTASTYLLLSELKAMHTEREREKVNVNNGQLHLQPPPRVVHASRVDQFSH